MTDLIKNAQQAIADAWASIDGKDINDPEYTDGYLWDAGEMITRLNARGYAVVPVDQLEGIIKRCERIQENCRQFSKEHHDEIMSIKVAKADFWPWVRQIHNITITMIKAGDV